MKRSFALPIAVALMVHSIVLFGFRSPASPVTPRPPATIPDLPHLIQVTQPPEPVDPANEDGPGGKHEAMPVLPDVPAPVDPDGDVFTTPVSPYSDPQPTRFMYRVDPSDYGPVGPGVGSERSGPVFDPRRLDHTPKASFQPPPAYPFEARARGLTGTVVVAFVVDPSGMVRDPVVVSSSDPVFDEPALRGVEHWRFEPGRVNNQVVSFRMAVPVEFNLDSN